MNELLDEMEAAQQSFVVVRSDGATNRSLLNAVMNRVDRESLRIASHSDPILVRMQPLVNQGDGEGGHEGQAGASAAPDKRGAGDVSDEFKTRARKFLEDLYEKLERTTDNLTIVIEEGHIDPSYRDMYYYQYSREFFEAGRFSLRLVFFAADLNEYLYSRTSNEDLSELCMGACVVSPLGDGAIGRTLINPEYVIDRGVEVRLSQFSINVFGKKIEIRAFPFREQDGEMMKCAEVTLLNLLSYYSNEYPDYHAVLPSEILSRGEKYSNERVTPSRGLPYNILSKILSDFRFFPRLYNADEVGKSVGKGGFVPKDVMFKRLLHWYVCSGIPVAVNVGNPHTSEDGHSLVCVGYEDVHDRDASVGDSPKAGDVSGGSAQKGLELTPEMLRWSYRLSRRDLGTGERQSCRLVHSADFPRQYVVIDDAQLPYAIRPFHQLSEKPTFECINYAVPLHRSMAMDAMDAYENAITILSNYGIGLLNWGRRGIGDGETLVMSLFLTTVRGYKRERSAYERKKMRGVLDQMALVSDADSDEFAVLSERAETHQVISSVYEMATLPHFIWVVELTRLDRYRARNAERRVCAELVLDAGSGGAGNAVDKLIFMRYPDSIYYRDQTGEEFFMTLPETAIEDDPILPYQENLIHVSPR